MITLPTRPLVSPLIALLILLIPSAGLTQNLKKAPPTAHSEMTRLSCGARLILLPEPQEKLASLTVFIGLPETQSKSEEATVDLVARALFYGSVNRSRESVEASAALIGGDLTILRTPSYICIRCTTVNAELREAIYLLSEAIKNADFPLDALQRANRERRQQLQISASQREEQARISLTGLMRGQPVPEERDYQRVTQERARAYFLTHFVPARTVICLAGRFHVASATDSLDANLSDYTREIPPRQPEYPTQPADMKGASELQRQAVPGESALLLVGCSAPGLNSPDYPAYTLLHTLLGVGHASRLFQRLREEEGIGYEVNTRWPVDRDGPLIASVNWSPAIKLLAKTSSAPESSGNAVKEQEATPEFVLGRLNSVLDSVISTPPSSEELERARQVALVRELLRREKVRDRAFLAGWFEISGAGWQAAETLPEQLKQVTADQVLAAARKYLGVRAVWLLAPDNSAKK